jgi:hypothetical protein
LHDLQAFTPDGTPLGTLWADYINRTETMPRRSAQEKRQERKQKPIEQKESVRWIDGLRQAARAAAQLPQVQCVCIADSEADIYELFAEQQGQHEQQPAGKQRSAGQVDWLIRACQNRALAPACAGEDNGEPEGEAHGLVRQAVMSTPVLYTAQLRIRSRQAKTKVEKRVRRTARDQREIQVEVRAATVTLRAPWRADRKLPDTTVNVVSVRETNPPKRESGAESVVEWILITTLPIDNLQQVRRVVEYYCVRWNIEILFRTLKSGCRSRAVAELNSGSSKTSSGSCRAWRCI